MDKGEFLGRYTDRMVDCTDMDYIKDAEFLTHIAGGTWDVYKKEPDKRTPEEWADEQIDSWED